MTAPDWQAHFQPDERLLWQGAPLHGRLLTFWPVIKIVLAVPFVLIGCAMFAISIGAVFVADTLMAAAAALFLMAIGLFVGILGGFVMAEPFLDPAAQARQDRYALTDRAAYVARTRPVQSVKVTPILPGTVVELEKGKRTQSVRIYSLAPADPDEYPAVLRAEFDNIADGEAVFSLVRRIAGGTP